MIMTVVGNSNMTLLRYNEADNAELRGMQINSTHVRTPYP